jgi:hypothetical protein
MTCLKRYISGEYEQVWHELQALGAAVREEAVYADALAVARETMRRIRKNIETLILRLTQIGFVFGYDHLLLARLSRPQNFSGWEAYFRMLSWVREQPPVFLPSNLLDEALADRMRNDYAFEIHPEEEAAAYREDWLQDPTSPPYMKHYLDEIEQEVGPIPLSMRAWYEEVGAVNFYGYHAGWNVLVRSFRPTLYQEGKLDPLNLMSNCDPLQVCVLNQHWRDHIGPIGEEEQTFAFALERFEKDFMSGTSSSYQFSLPDPGADALMWNPFSQQEQISFVQYLRLSLLQWAGFPGMMGWPKVPQEDLAFLTEGLIPF